MRRLYYTDGWSDDRQTAWNRYLTELQVEIAASHSLKAAAANTELWF
jgi:hypothetical protein